MIKIYTTVVVGALAWWAAAQSQELDVYNIHHWTAIQDMFIRNQRRENIEKNATHPTDAIDDALSDFYETHSI